MFRSRVFSSEALFYLLLVDVSFDATGQYQEPRSYTVGERGPRSFDRRSTILAMKVSRFLSLRTSIFLDTCARSLEATLYLMRAT